MGTLFIKFGNPFYKKGIGDTIVDTIVDTSGFPKNPPSPKILKGPRRTSPPKTFRGYPFLDKRVSQIPDRRYQEGIADTKVFYRAIFTKIIGVTKMNPIDRELLDILACPVCKADIEYDEASEKLVCRGCGRRYPIKDGIPIMLEEEAELPSNMKSDQK